MGSTDFYPEERPVRTVTVEDLWVDVHPVTNEEFARFVADTGHVTVPERAPDAADFPGADLHLLVPGSQVFTPTRGPVPLDDWTRWWRWSSRLLGRQLGIGDATVARAWRKYRVQPWRRETFKFSTDPQLEEGPRRRRAVPEPADQRDRAVRGREVPDPGA